MELQPAAATQTCASKPKRSSFPHPALFSRAPLVRALIVILPFPAYATPNTSTSNGRPGRRSDRLTYLLFDIVGNAAAIPRVTALRLNASLALLVRQEGSGGGGELGALSCPTGGAGRGDRQGIAGLRGRKGGKSKVSQSSRRFRDAGQEARNKKKTLSKPQRASRSTVILR